MGLADNPGPDDEFFAHMREQLEHIEVTDENNVQNLSEMDLLQELNKVNESLRKIGEMHKPITKKGRELHSRRSALTVEKHRRIT